MANSRELDFKIGEWWARPRLNELAKGDTTVRLEGRSMDVLVCLAWHSPGVVTKQRIIEEVWGEAFVGDEVISHAIWELRKTLDDDARDPRYIQTIPRKGYRLIAEVIRPTGSSVPIEGAQIDRYEVVHELGRGAMGVVYKAVDRRLQRTVALKFLAPELTRDVTSRQRFQREAQLAASLDHPNLATVHEIGETAQGHQYIVTAYYGGGSLRERLAAGPLAQAEALELGCQIAAGLDEAHRSGIIHRDVKPANVLMADNGTAKIVDFGIAKLLGATSLTRTGVSLGTPAYKSPEQSRGDPVDHRTDLWSLGVVLYEMITGRQPFRGEYEQAVVHSILAEKPTPLVDAAGQPVPEDLQRVVVRAMAKEPNERYQTAEDLLVDLQQVARKVDDVRAEVPTEPAVPTLRRRFVLAAAVVALALVGLLASRFVAFPPASTSAGKAEAEVTRLVSQGILFEWSGDSSENLAAAEVSYRKALELDGHNPEVRARLALLLARQQLQFPEPGRLREIRRLADGSLEADPELWLAWLARSKLRLLEQQPGEAAEAARTAIELTPESDSDRDRGHALLGEALIRLGRIEEGLGEIQRATEVGRGFIRARLVLAYHLWHQGRLEAAAAEYARVLRDYDPSQITALNNLGLLYYQMGRYQDALPLLKKGFERRRDPRIANNLGAVFYNLKRWEEAIEEFRQAIELDPLVPNPYVGLGDTYRALGRSQEATRWYEEALERYDRLLAADGAPVRRRCQRAVCAAKLGRVAEAVVEIENALTQAPHQSGLSFYAAQVYALAGDREKVYRYLLDAVRDLYSLEVFRTDPSFADFQEDGRFQAILEGHAVDPSRDLNSRAGPDQPPP